VDGGSKLRSLARSKTSGFDGSDFHGDDGLGAAWCPYVKDRTLGQHARQ
jgi:hypothetical protein